MEPIKQFVNELADLIDKYGVAICADDGNNWPKCHVVFQQQVTGS